MKTKIKKTIKKYINESGMIASNWPDIGGISSDDDTPTGNIIMGNRYVRKKYLNRINKYNSIWDVDKEGKYQYDWFENLGGMEQRINYSKTLQKMKKLFPKLFKHTRNVSDKKIQKEYDSGLLKHKSVKNALGHT